MNFTITVSECHICLLRCVKNASKTLANLNSEIPANTASECHMCQLRWVKNASKTRPSLKPKFHHHSLRMAYVPIEMGEKR